MSEERDKIKERSEEPTKWGREEERRKGRIEYWEGKKKRSRYIARRRESLFRKRE